MFVRNSAGDLVVIDESKMISEKQLYNTIWSIKFNKVVSSPAYAKVSVERMKEYLSSKQLSL
jgi:hypothetical protein